EGADAKNPKPYVSAQFSFDNQALVALTAQEAHLVAGGQIVQRSGGIAGRVAPIRHGALIFLSDGNDKIIVLADGRFGAPIPVGKGGVVSLSASAAGTEMDGGVRLMKDGKPAWEHHAARKLTKRIATKGERVAVAYWGGTVSVLEGGSAKSTRVFP